MSDTELELKLARAEFRVEFRRAMALEEELRERTVERDRLAEQVRALRSAVERMRRAHLARRLLLAPTGGRVQ